MTYKVFRTMPFSDRLIALRKQRGLTQEALADLIEITKTQVYRYESGTSQPTLDVIKKIAIALSVTSDELIFEVDERKPDDSLTLLLEGVNRLDSDEKHVIREMIEGMLVKHQTKQMVKSLAR
ncbi:helix-turn-helix domain-containing protein [Teredinibacter purpureus]|uniref:helix-turn-helix domain-containing protein n=1 Tax=Teredinibacter purpureus TaxID=2731756 RepID=UPI000696D35F|nr:helix-turn-helix transcriptional regulator [Teredinibacter purpureus]